MSHVFISYAHEDKKFVHNLYEQIKSSGLPVWYDESLTPGSEWQEVINDNIHECRSFVVVMSPNSQNSKPVYNEIELALSEHKPIYPILLQGECFQKLAHIQYSDARESNYNKAPQQLLKELRKPLSDDQRANIKNPNNPAYKFAQDNRSNQLNPKSLTYCSSRENNMEIITRWKYLTVKISSSNDDRVIRIVSIQGDYQYSLKPDYRSSSLTTTQFVEFCNSVGKEGWELCSVIPTLIENEIRGVNSLLIFKQPFLENCR